MKDFQSQDIKQRKKKAHHSESDTSSTVFHKASIKGTKKACAAQSVSYRTTCCVLLHGVRARAALQSVLD